MPDSMKQLSISSCANGKNVLKQNKTDIDEGGLEMPKKTFLKLPAEKQERILKAAADEFIQYKDQYEKSSVNRIAERADISVGSIYKYFYDKDDLFFCVFNHNKKTLEAVPDSDTLYDYSSKEIEMDIKADQVSSDLADIIFNNAGLFEGLVFSNTTTPDYLDKLKAYLAKDQDRGLLKDGIDLEVAAYLYSTIEYNAYQYCLEHGRDFSTDTEIFRKMTDLLFFGIYRESAETEMKEE